MKSLKNLYNEHAGKVSDKWSLYLDAYDEMFSPFRDRKLNLLEIGIQNGGSLELWARYFDRAEQIVGCDINPDCARLTYDDPRISVVVGDANSDAAMAEILQIASSFDLIIDDGSHTSSDIIRSFARYFPRLRDDGLFVIEDLHCSYWREFEGGLYAPYSSMSFLKRLSDIVNYEHWGKAGSRAELVSGFKESLGESFDETVLAQVHSVTFLNSVCIIRKRPAQRNELGERIVVGEEAAVTDEPLQLSERRSVAADQSANPWTQLDRGPDELWQEQVRIAQASSQRVLELESLSDELKQTSQEQISRLAQLETELSRVQAENAELLNSACWRYTAPVRTAVTTMRKLQSLTRIASPVIKAQGGVRPTARKLWSVLNREGLEGLRMRVRHQFGTQHQLQAASVDVSFLTPVTRPATELLQRRVLIIAELSIPQCTKYRVTQKVELLASLGIEANVVSWTEYQTCMTLLSSHSEVIFYRAPGFPLVLNLIAEAQRLGVTSYWEVDDIIFDREVLAQTKALSGLDPAVYRELLAGAELYLAAMQACDQGIASTTALRGAMEQRTGKPVYVVENALDKGTIAAAERINAVPKVAGSQVRIVYGSGTNTHNVDFEQAADAIIKVMERYEHVRFRLIGTLELPDTFERFGDRVEKIPFCSYDEYLGFLAECDINIAPLEKSLFTDAKSNIKYLEAAIVKLPSVCSKAQAFCDAIESGEHGFLCGTTDEWTHCLSALVEDASLRSRMGQDAYEHVMHRYAPGYIAAEQVAGIFPAQAQRHKPRVLSVNVYYSPRSFGGATIVAEELNKLIDASRYNVYVFTTLAEGVADPYSVRRYEADQISVFGCVIPSGLEPGKQFENPDVDRAFSEALAAIKPDLVHFHSIQNIGVTPLEICRTHQVPYVVTVHDPWWLCGRQFMIDRSNQFCGQYVIDLKVCASCVDNRSINAYRSNLLRDRLLAASRILAPSRYFADFHIANGLPAERVVVNKNGIRQPLCAERIRRSENVRFAYVGGNTEIKGVDLVRSAFGSPMPEQVRLRVVDNTLNLGYSSFPADYFDGCGDVEIVPAYSAKNIDVFYADIDVLLFPTRCKESFGLTVREALARNVWVIATDGGAAVEDIVDGVNGFVIPFDDDGTALRRAVLATVDLFDGISIGEQVVFGEGGSIRFFEEQALELEGIYDEAINERQAGSIAVSAV
ncbi:glycosyltransferase [Pseudomonas saliphila]|uniref:glycosyltransferase n=1 Tax=Pseudomonas saliphila TaxID=2586906 RepID=UPI00123C725A|nr:glycosyltransferase [Pseudomonas saliphila]